MRHLDATPPYTLRPNRFWVLPPVVRGRRHHPPWLPLQTRRRTCPVLRRLPTVWLHYERNARGSRQRHQHPLPASGGLGQRDRAALGVDRHGRGIFLSPLLLFTGWAGTRPTSGTSAAFILVNSIAGLAGSFASIRYLPDALPVWAVAAAAGGLIGSELGSRKLQSNGIRRALAAVLVIAGLKLMLI
jgi:hypothetical protein